MPVIPNMKTLQEIRKSGEECERLGLPWKEENTKKLNMDIFEKYSEL